MNAVRDAHGLTSTEKLVLFVLASRARNDGRAWTGFRRLASDCALALNTVTRAIRGLEAKGWLVVDRRHGAPNFYRVSVATTATVGAKELSQPQRQSPSPTVAMVGAPTVATTATPLSQPQLRTVATTATK